MLRICIQCQSPFRPHIKVPNQKVCIKKKCQKARRLLWQKQKLQKDDDYKKNQTMAQKAWIKKNPDYWRNYRENHPDYVKRNRILQRKRNFKTRHGVKHLENKTPMIAKMDELIEKSSLISGYYMLYPIAGRRIAKMDEMLVKIEVITRS